jgi:hypothetical protein
MAAVDKMVAGMANVKVDVCDWDLFPPPGQPFPDGSFVEYPPPGTSPTVARFYVKPLKVDKLPSAVNHFLATFWLASAHMRNGWDGNGAVKLGTGYPVPETGIPVPAGAGGKMCNASASSEDQKAWIAAQSANGEVFGLFPSVPNCVDRAMLDELLAQWSGVLDWSKSHLAMASGHLCKLSMGNLPFVRDLLKLFAAFANAGDPTEEGIARVLAEFGCSTAPTHFTYKDQSALFKERMDLLEKQKDGPLSANEQTRLRDLGWVAGDRQVTFCMPLTCPHRADGCLVPAESTFVSFHPHHPLDRK